MKKIIITLVVCLIVFAAFDLRAQTQPVPELTSAAYASMKKDDVYVVMFSMRGCGPCIKAKKTFLPSLAEKYKDESNIHVYLFPVDADAPASDGTHLYSQLGVTQAPAFVVLYNGTAMFSHTGFLAEISAKLESEIASAVSKVK